MIYPGYLLNPGDMFQVDIERVLFATGAKKGKAIEASKPSEAAETDEPKAEAEEVEEVEEAATGGAAEEATTSEALDEAAGAEAVAANAAAVKGELRALLARARSILADEGELSVKRKQALRAFVKEARKTASRLPRASADESSAAVDDLTRLLSGLSMSSADTAAAATASSAEADALTAD